MDLSVQVRNARLDAIETTIGTAPIMRLFTGSAPASTAAADSGTEIVAITLPSDWLAAAAGGSIALAGTWTGTAGASGTVGHFRVYDSGDTTCHMQGTVTATGGGGEVVLDVVAITSGQTVAISAFTVTDGDA
jgi:hypothetical protein